MNCLIHYYAGRNVLNNNWYRISRGFDLAFSLYIYANIYIIRHG